MAFAPNEYPVPIPKEMVNDDAYLIVALKARPGEEVAAGRELAEMESSKATFTICSPAGGFFYPSHTEGDMVGVGELLGIIRSEPPADTIRTDKDAGIDQTTASADPRFSRPAWELLQSAGITTEAFAGFAHVRRKDVEEVIAGAGTAEESGGAPELPAFTAAQKETGAVLLGGGGHARECVDIMELNGTPGILGIIDTKAKPGSEIAGYPVLGDNAILDRLLATGIYNLVLAYGISGNHAARGAHFRQLLKRGHMFPSITHPKASVSRQAVIGCGVQIMGGSLVGSCSSVGDACIINSNAVVSHDCIIGTNVHIAPGAILAGKVTVGNDTVIGMGTTIYMRVRIGSGVVIHNGANIFADVPGGMAVKGEWRGTNSL